MQPAKSLIKPMKSVYLMPKTPLQERIDKVREEIIGPKSAKLFKKKAIK
jgi:hypothetical protein